MAAIFQFGWRGVVGDTGNLTLKAAPTMMVFRGMSLNPSREKVKELFEMQDVSYSTVAALCFLAYDVIITFVDEVNYVWPMSRSTTKAVFFFTRYFPLVFLFSIQFYGSPRFTYSNHDCYIWNAYQAVATILIIAGVDYILLLRVFALYASNKTIKSLTLFLYGAEVVTTSVGMGLAVPGLRYDEFCGVVDAPGTFLIAAGVPILFQAYLFAITAYKFFQAVRSGSGWADAGIVKIVMRDSTWAFVLLFLILIAEAFLYGLAQDAYIGVLYGWLNAAFSFCGYRILININKRAGAHGYGRYTSSRSWRSRSGRLSEEMTRTGMEFTIPNRILTPGSDGEEEEFGLEGRAMDGRGVRQRGDEAEDDVENGSVERGRTLGSEGLEMPVLPSSKKRESRTTA